MSREFTPNQALYNDSPILNAANPFPVTFAGWSNRDNNNTGAFISIGSKNEDKNFIALGYAEFTIHSLWCLTRNNAVNDFSAISTIPTNPNTWLHFAAVLPDSSTITIYTDGQTGQYYQGSGPQGFASFDRNGIGYIPRLTTAFAQYYEGLLGEWGAWDVALTQTEIQTLAAGYSPLFIRPQNLIFYMPMINDDDNDLVGKLNYTEIGSPGISKHPRALYSYSNSSLGVLAAVPSISQYKHLVTFNSNINSKVIFESDLQ